MTTDALIDSLARNIAPVSPRAVDRRLAASAAAGVALALSGLLAALGTRSDLAVVVTGVLFWAKVAYVVALGATAFALLRQLARPDSQRLGRVWLVTVPVGMLASVSALETALTGEADRAALVGAPSWSCVPLIVVLAVPVFVGLVHALRRMAQTRLRAAGAAAGLAAAALAAAVYCLHCRELSPVYVLTRYSAALAFAALAGAALGPRLLRW